ncbi:MAG TPA: Na+/H+ antiporter NhaA [Mycobacteriales bacterium]|nr:Na+/H+ antiporter NhaA [Mycobacteriales bacterium]
MSGPRMSGRTVRGRGSWTPARAFVRTKSTSAVVLLAATIVALVWVNVDSASYQTVWRTVLSFRVGRWGVTQDLRGWVNNGLMTFFFLVVGLEARREFDMGELRDRRRLALPLVAGLTGLAVPVAIYVAVNAGHRSVHGWAAAMSTDTAFALGILALVGLPFQQRLRAFMLTVLVVDDLATLGVIATVYSRHLAVTALLTAIGLFAVLLLLRAVGVGRAGMYALLGVATWVALFESGVEPIVLGLAMGLLTYAYPAGRGDLERAADLFRLFREQPTPELARTARRGLGAAISPNDRLQQAYHPWTSYLIVPLFALANVGVVINGGVLARAFTSPVTLGILVGYVVGKPVGILGASWLVTGLTRGRVRPPVGWVAVAGGGAIAGNGLTLSLLISTLAFDGRQLADAKIGTLSAALAASLAGLVVFRSAVHLPRGLRARALLGTGEPVLDLTVPVEPDRDHTRGPDDAPVTVVEYGDFECPYCGQAEPAVRELLADFGDIRYVWRHLPLTDVHPHAQLAAQAAEVAAEQGAFWPMRELLLDHQGELLMSHLARYAEQLDLDVERFCEDLSRGVGVDRIAEDVDSADVAGVAGTPTFFVNGRRHHGAYDIAALTNAVRIARASAGTRS